MGYFKRGLQFRSTFQVQLPLYTLPQIPLMVLLMKVWIVVYNCGLINEDVGVFTSLEETKRAFREYTGFEWEPGRSWKDFGGVGYSEEFGECDIFEGYFVGQLIG
jgi:hypothetical protein